MKTKASKSKNVKQPPNGSDGKNRKNGKPSAGGGTEAALSTPASAPIAQETIAFVETELPLADIAPGYNARPAEEFTDAEQKELSDSIEKYGIQTRLWVWKLPKPATKGGANYELIGGERRWRAAQMTSRLMAPVKIYDCSRQQALMLGLIDNLQRKQLREIDQAFAYAKLIKEEGMRAWDPGEPGKSLGHRLNISKTKIYALLKLAELPKLGVQAVRSGELSASVGVRIARIPNKEMQAEALAAAIEQEWTDDDAAERIERHFMTELKGAPFDREDPKLNPKRGACGACPLRSGNQAEAFPEFAKGRGDICTDPACFRLKCERGFEVRAEAHRKAGGKVLTAKEAKEAGLGDRWSNVGGGYAELDDSANDIEEYNKTWGQLFKEQLKSGELLPVLAIANDGSAKHYELIRREDAVALAKKLGLVKKKSGGRDDYAQQQREAKAKIARDKVRTLHWLKAIGAAAAESEITAVQLVRGTCLWVMDRMHVDAQRRVAMSMDLERETFQLKEDGHPHAWLERALKQKLESCQELGEFLEFQCRLMAAPEYIANDGGLNSRAEIVAEMLGLTAGELARASREAVQAAAPQKKGKKGSDETQPELAPQI